MIDLKQLEALEAFLAGSALGVPELLQHRETIEALIAEHKQWRETHELATEIAAAPPSDESPEEWAERMAPVIAAEGTAIYQALNAARVPVTEDWLALNEIPTEAPGKFWFWSKGPEFDGYETLEGPYEAGRVMQVELWLVRSSMTRHDRSMLTVFHSDMPSIEALREYGARFRFKPLVIKVPPAPSPEDA